MPMTDMPPDKWTSDCPDCPKKDHAWTRCRVGKKSNPGWFALSGDDYKIYEECSNCKVCRLLVVRGNNATYTYRRNLKNRW